MKREDYKSKVAGWTNNDLLFEITVSLQTYKANKRNNYLWAINVCLKELRKRKAKEALRNFNN